MEGLTIETQSETFVLQGARILIVEDEPLIGLDLECAVRDGGGTVVGLAATIEQARKLIELPRIDAAILDLRLNGLSIQDVIKRLMDRSIPCIFYTGLEDAPTARSWATVPVLSKPANPDTIVNLLAH